MNMPELSAVIIAFNEEARIGACLESLRGVADEVVVVDSYSTDRTGEICKEYGTVLIRHEFGGHIEQKNFALSQASHEHVLCLDADEVLSQELANSILEVKDNWTNAGYCCNRLTNYCGKWIRHATWYPSRKTRLVERSKASWEGINPHDQLILTDGSRPVHLAGDLLHYSYATIEEHRQKVRNYAELASQSYFSAGIRSNFVKIAIHPFWRFLRDYIFHLGLLDGYYGLVIAWLSARETYLKYSMLRRLYRDRGRT